VSVFMKCAPRLAKKYGSTCKSQDRFLTIKSTLDKQIDRVRSPTDP
jgi:hypothetical protein